MDSGLRFIVAAFHRTCDAFFRKDVKLVRGNNRARVVLVPRADEGAPPHVPRGGDLTSRKAAAELALMLGQLAALLDEAPETRRALRHLAHVEQALAHQGLGALQWLPVELLQRALEQFEERVTNWSPVGLATLRSKMAVAIIERGPIRNERLPEPVHCTIPLEHSDDKDETDSALEAVYAAMGVAAAPNGAVAA